MSLGSNMLCPLIYLEFSKYPRRRLSVKTVFVVRSSTPLLEHEGTAHPPATGPKEILAKPAENSVRCLTITWP